MPIEAVVFIFLALIAFAVLSVKWTGSRSLSIIEQWAQENDFELLESERTFFGGPFWLTKARNQTVYRVKIKDRAGHVRTGYVRCGSFFAGLLSDKSTVRWDDE